MSVEDGFAQTGAPVTPSDSKSQRLSCKDQCGRAAEHDDAARQFNRGNPASGSGKRVGKGNGADHGL